MSSFPRAAVFTLLSLVPACGGPPPAETPSQPDITGVEQYFPLGDGFVYTYQTVDEGSGSEDMLLLRVSRPDASHAKLQTGSGVRLLQITSEAIRREGSGFVLRAPLREGATWDGDNGGSTRVEAVDVTVSVPAGTFKDCVRTVEEIGGAGRGRITSVYCKGVGIAEMNVEQWEGADHAAKRFQLRSYGPPVNLDAEK